VFQSNFLTKPETIFISPKTLSKLFPTVSHTLKLSHTLLHKPLCDTLLETIFKVFHTLFRTVSHTFLCHSENIKQFFRYFLKGFLKSFRSISEILPESIGKILPNPVWYSSQGTQELLKIPSKSIRNPFQSVFQYHTLLKGPFPRHSRRVKRGKQALL
jgi:hypothetical protein